MAVESASLWIGLGSIAWGGAMAWAAACLLDALDHPGSRGESESRFESERLKRLRESSGFYARFEPAIAALASRDRTRRPGPRPGLEAMLAAAGESDWTPPEFLAAARLKGGAAAAAAGLYGLWGQSSVAYAVVAAALAFGAWQGLALWALRARAVRRRGRIAARLPYVVDLLALIQEAGGHLLDAFGVVAKEMESHPLADELGQVHRAIRLGIPHHEALRAMAGRVGLPALTELVTTVIQGEAGGTPIADIFRMQADQMRIRRTQAIEAAAARANVHMVYPGLISMIACLLIMGSQFVIWMMSANGGL